MYESFHIPQLINCILKPFTQQVWHKLSPSRPDPVAVDTVRTCLQRLTTLLHDDTRAPVPHLCLSFAASSQFYLTVARIALSLNNEEIVREAVAWFNALVDNDEENLLNDERFAEALMNFAENISSPNGIAAGSQTEGEILELMFGIAAKIRLEPELLPIWFMSEDQSSTVTSAAGTPGLGLGDHKRFPLCYQFVGRVYHEGRAGDFARTGLLYIFESVSHSPELERWIIESDLPTLMASGLGALYSQLSRFVRYLCDGVRRLTYLPESWTSHILFKTCRSSLPFLTRIPSRFLTMWTAFIRMSFRVGSPRSCRI